MTRLREDDIDTVSARLPAYNETLRRLLGKGLAEVAAYSQAGSPGDFAVWQDTPVGVIPVSCGQGVIGGFAHTVKEIIAFLGFSSFVTARSDVGGLAEAVQRGAQVVFLADDDHFVAIHLAKGKVVDNAAATGRGYAAALALLAGGLTGEKALVIGAGPVGAGAAAYLTEQGAQVVIYDSNPEKSAQLSRAMAGVTAADDMAAALAACRLVVEATPAAGVIDCRDITDRMLVAAPGVPLGITPQGEARLSGRLIHDVLEIGVATMLFTVFAD
ncbi:3-methylornithyl-N6-L-lysine dehydrogenase PylD [Methylomusa anaerophila]|uniref:Glutamyl-tRNA reductase n=1 Tax=Methylomusa anaerophila TaxID=1930071 RepID=A0A348AJN7_9FIRM|nr:3-methylornithyl-N6-L-lysine dehydrogenase PylD [Methylomusa anaerophila]BBB91285.1 glutamyl-tRNA reductase [Methylomusa anaerophila]